MTTVQITLPDALAEQAERAGLLTSEVFVNWLRNELKASSAERLSELVERMDAIPDPNAMSPDEVAEVIKKMRAERQH